MSEHRRNIQVPLGNRSYPIEIGRGLLNDSTLLAGHLAGIEVAVVSNTTVAPRYRSLLDAALEGKSVLDITLPDGERYKTIASLEQIYEQLLQHRLSRNCTLVALGGGVIGDITGFAAATYLRGVSFIQLPTTLLAMVDSSVGGKTAVNHPLGKNMIGAFYQPRAVLADLALLDTLPDREYRAGLAEVIKYGLIRDGAFFDWLEEHADALVARNPGVLAEVVARSCANKSEVVAVDEREAGQRALLNLGHTFGHAIETAQSYQGLLHGEAVAVGMLLAARLSARMNLLGQDSVERCRTLLGEIGLPVELPEGLEPEQLLGLMANDKKVVEGRLRFVILNDIGHAALRDDVSESDVLEVLAGH